MKQTLKKMAVLLSVALVCAPMGAMAANKLIVKDSQGTVDKMVVTDTGRIGIGTNAPGGSIYIKATPTAAWHDAAIKVEGTDVTGGGGFLGYSVRSASLPLNNDRLGYFLFGSYNDATAVHSAGVTVTSEGDWTTSSMPTNFTFSTTPAGSTSRQERFKIAANGNVGIGYYGAGVTPVQKLEVKGGIKVNSTGTKPNCDVTSRGTLWVTQSTTTVADTAELCTKDAGTAYSWKALY